MQQRQLRLGDILDDYCPRERRLTNHAVVAMVGAEVRLTRCTTCDAEHEYRHARVPRQRPKPEAPALLGPGAAVVPKRLPAAGGGGEAQQDEPPSGDSPLETPTPEPSLAASAAPDEHGDTEAEAGQDDLDSTADSGPVHRRLIRATFPRIEGQPPPSRPPSDFTIRQPAGRGQRFRPRPQRMDQPFHGRTNSGGGNTFRGGPRSNAGRGAPTQRPSNHRGGQGRRRPK